MIRDTADCRFKNEECSLVYDMFLLPTTRRCSSRRRLFLSWALLCSSLWGLDIYVYVQVYRCIMVSSLFSAFLVSTFWSFCICYIYIYIYAKYTYVPWFPPTRRLETWRTGLFTRAIGYFGSGQTEVEMHKMRLKQHEHRPPWAVEFCKLATCSSSTHSSRRSHRSHKGHRNQKPPKPQNAQRLQKPQKPQKQR